MLDDYISHYGVKRRSGRYPWGSGDEPYQRGSKVDINGIMRDLQKGDIKGVVDSLGISAKTIAEASRDYGTAKRMMQQAVGEDFEMSPSDYRAAKRVITQIASGGGSVNISDSDREAVNGMLQQIMGVGELDLSKSDYELVQDVVQKVANGEDVSEISKSSLELVKTVTKKVGFWNLLWGSLKNMGRFFKRKISELFDKLKD